MAIYGSWTTWLTTFAREEADNLSALMFTFVLAWQSVLVAGEWWRWAVWLSLLISPTRVTHWERDRLKDSETQRWKEGRRWQMGHGTFGTRRPYQGWCVRLCVYVCACERRRVWVGGCYTGRKPKQPVQFAHLITSVREGRREKEKVRETKREREPSEEQM